MPSLTVECTFTVHVPVSCSLVVWCWFSWFKVAEHSFQEPIPNSPLLLSYLSFGTRFSQESRLTTEEFILAFWLRCELLPW